MYSLSIVTSATVSLVPAPKAVALAVLGYASMPAAAQVVLGLLPHQPVAIEGLDARMVEVFRSRRGAKLWRRAGACAVDCVSRFR